MNSEMQRRLYEMEVTPPPAVWEKLSLNIDEINEDNLVAKKILNIELLPPATVWEKLSLNNDEINEDNRIAGKILTVELTPPVGVWEKIDSTLNATEEIPVQKKGRIINFRRLAAAAVFIGVIATAWILLRNNNKPPELAGVEKPAQQKVSNDTNATNKKENTNIIDSPIEPLNSTPQIAAASTSNSENQKPIRATKYSTASRNRADISVEPEAAQYAVLNTPLNNSFDRPIDDLSLVTSDQNYYTMVNANGRLVKIPAQLASLAPHLQDKPVAEDYQEVMFGEGNYWRETLNEWRKKIVSSPVTTGDAFTSFVELLKSVQTK